jgi:hypothetical protein
MVQICQHSTYKPMASRDRGKLFVCAAVLFVQTVAAAAAGPSQSFTLYRNSVLDPKMRIHLATFDAVDGEAYNRGNCDQAQALFQAQDGVKTKFWCEQGKFKR